MHSYGSRYGMPHLRFTKEDAVRGAFVMTSFTSATYCMYSSMPPSGLVYTHKDGHEQ